MSLEERLAVWEKVEDLNYQLFEAAGIKVFRPTIQKNRPSDINNVLAVTVAGFNNIIDQHIRYTGDGAAHATVCLDALIGLENLFYIDLNFANVSHKGYEGLPKMLKAKDIDMQIFVELRL